jgi:hypothetical protein
MRFGPGSGSVHKFAHEVPGLFIILAPLNIFDQSKFMTDRWCVMPMALGGSIAITDSSKSIGEASDLICTKAEIGSSWRLSARDETSNSALTSSEMDELNVVRYVVHRMYENSLRVLHSPLLHCVYASQPIPHTDVFNV